MIDTIKIHRAATEMSVGKDAADLLIEYLAASDTANEFQDGRQLVQLDRDEFAACHQLILKEISLSVKLSTNADALRLLPDVVGQEEADFILARIAVDLAVYPTGHIAVGGPQRIQDLLALKDQRRALFLALKACDIVAIAPLLAYSAEELSPIQASAASGND
jgi:hypothetical protein